jgi:hypothetical protein
MPPDPISPTPPPAEPARAADAFTREDGVLYVFCFLLLGFIAAYFLHVGQQTNEDILSPLDQEMVRSFKLKNPPDSLRETTQTNFLKAQLLLVYQRYEFSNRFARTNSYIRFISFLVGTLVTLLGMMVVIRGVRETPFNLNLDSPQRIALKLQASSPGLILACAGTLIIMATILKTSEANLQDRGIALPGMTPDTTRHSSPVPFYMSPDTNDSK